MLAVSHSRDEYPYYNHPTDMDIPIFEKGPGAMLGIVDGVTIPLPVDRTHHYTTAHARPHTHTPVSCR